MHPLHAIDAGLAERPATVQDLIDAMPPAGLTFIFHADDDSADATVEELRLALAVGLGTGAAPLDEESPQAWSIFWHGGWWMLRGHLFGHGGRFDPTSPILLVSRNTLAAIYGPKVPELAVMVLGNTLASEAFDQSRAS